MRPVWWGVRSKWGPWAAFAIGSRSRFFETGEARLAILSLLDEGPKHGYQLIKDLEERSGKLYRASAGTVYPTLQELDDEGLITSERQEGKRIYRITEEGKKELERDPEAVRRIWQRAESWQDWGQCMGPDAVMFTRPLVAILKAGLRSAPRAAGRPERERQIHEILERACRELEDLEKTWGR